MYSLMYALLWPFYRLSLFGIMLFSFGISEAQDISRVEPGKVYRILVAIDSFIDLSGITLLHVDKTARMSFEEVQAERSGGDFIPLADYRWEGRFQRGRYAYWLHFTLQNETADTLHSALHCGDKDSLWLYSRADSIVHLSTAGRAFRKTADEGGSLVPGKFFFAIELPPRQAQEFWVRVRNTPDFYLSLKPVLYDRAYLLHKRVDDLYPFFFVHGLFLGLLLFFFIYALAHFVQNRELSFLYFSLYVLGIMLLYYRGVQFDDPVVDFFSRGFDLRGFYYPITFFIYLTHILFLDKFLETRASSPMLHRFIRYASIGIVAALVISQSLFWFVDKWWVWEFFLSARAVFLGAALCLLVLVWRSKDRLYRYMLVGEAFLVVSVIAVMALSFRPVHLTEGYWDAVNTPAYIGIFLQMSCFLLGLGYKSRRAEVEKTRMEGELMRRQAEARYLQEVDLAKTRLYTNITHEFRTPLTVINGMVEQIRDNPRRWLGEGLEMIRRNSDNLLRLVNQILNLRKLEAGDLPVRMVQGDVIHYLKYIVESFHSFAGAKGVAIHFLAGEEEFRMDYDPEKLLSIISNLLSNAVKFTLNGGEVFFSVSLEGQDAESLVMRVQDTGTGIAPEDIPFIFERFYQADDGATRRGEGSGIGLALTRELVKLLKGEIGVESKLRHGTEFTVRLPVSREAATAAEEDKPGIRRQAQSFLPIGAKSQSSAETGATSTGKPLALLIEDNADVITYLKAGIEGAYSIATAHNGAQGVEKALHLVPDIIISDVMMPGKDGFELCRILKQDERTSHIPIILLTARADQDAKVEGLERGADAYLAKPFDKAELLVRMRKLLELRQRLQAHYAALAGQGEKGNAPERKEPEDSFVLRIRRIVENHLSDPDFTVEQLCREAFVGHSQLHRKLTALTGYSAVRFIRLVRLAKAKELLPDRKLTITEIAFSCGFHDPVYFTRVFKTEFGRTPSGFRAASGGSE